jgi:hypothetical protein
LVVTPATIKPASAAAATIQSRQLSNIQRHYANPDIIREIKGAYASGTAQAPLKHGAPPPTSPAPQQSAANTSPLTIGASFTGLGFLDGGGYVPPDTTVAAGTNNLATVLLEAVNLTGEIFDTSGASLASFNLSNFAYNPLADSVSDPRVLYDSANGGHWLISLTTFAPSGDYGWNLAVSATSDPAGSYYVYYISTATVPNPDGSTGSFPDFPKIGLNGDKLVLTGDAFSTVQKGFRTSYKFQGTEFIVLNKSEFESGGPACLTFFAPSQGAFAIEPALHLPPTSTPASSNPGNLYMAAVNSGVSSTSALEVWTVTGVPTYDATTNSCTGAASASPTTLSIDTISTPPNAQQKGTGTLIDTNDDSLLDAVFRDGSQAGSLWVSANDACVPAGDSATRSCARLMEVSIPGTGAMSVAQDFDLVEPGTYYYFPAIRTDASGDLVAAFSASSSNSYASVYATMQLSGETANTLGYYGLVHAGDAAYSVNPPRWGDYSGAGIDPDDTTVWVAGEYATTCPFFGSCWGTWQASIP